MLSSFSAIDRALKKALANAAKVTLRFRSLIRAEQGVAALEFAIIAPVLILLYVGASELAQAAMTSKRVESLSRTLVDLVSQQPTSSQSSSLPAPGNATTQPALQAIFNASLAVLAPSPLATLTMTVSAVDIVNNASGVCCVFKVRWSYTQGGTLRPCAVNLTPVPPTQAPSPNTVSSAMTPPLSGSALSVPIPILISDVSYVYSGAFPSSWINFLSGMHRTSYMLPRTPGQVIVKAPLSTTSNQSGLVCY